MRQALQRQCHRAGRLFSRGGFDSGESEKEGGEKERKRETGLHCAEGETADVVLEIAEAGTVPWERKREITTL